MYPFFHIIHFTFIEVDNLVFIKVILIQLF